jgi:hypothetical protein
VLVLGVERVGGDYLGGPRGAVELRVGDTVILDGHRETLEGLDRRAAGSAGNWEHFTSGDQQKQAQTEDQAQLRATKAFSFGLTNSKSHGNGRFPHDN